MHFDRMSSKTRTRSAEGSRSQGLIFWIPKFKNQIEGDTFELNYDILEAVTAMILTLYSARRVTMATHQVDLSASHNL